MSTGAADPRMAGLSPGAIADMHAAARAIRDGAPDAAARLLDAVLAGCPGHPEALRLQGILAYRCRRPDIARGCYQRALAQRPDDALLHSDLGSAHMACGDADAAFESWRCACALAPGEAMSWFNLGRNLQLQGRGAEAAEALEHACRLAPGLLPAAVLLGDALSHLGRLDEAAARYRAAIAHEPACGDAWRGLCNLRTHPFADGDAAVLHAQLQRGDLRPQDRIALGHALGRLLEERGEYPSALDALRAANDLQHRLAPWRVEAFDRYVDAALEATAALPAPLDPGLGGEAILIVGLPRSGSTLVEQVLAAHPEVEGASELPDLGEVLVAESRRRGVPYPAWVPQATAADWDRLGRDYLARTARWRERRPRFTDKLPENWKHAGVLRAMLPAATVLEVRRDPLETAWSCFRQQFLQQPHFSCRFEDLGAYLRGCARAMDLWRARDPARIHLFRYESLPEAPETATRQLLDACGLTFDPACLASHRAPRSVRTASAAQVRQPLRRDTARAAAYGALLDPLRAALGVD